MIFRRRQEPNAVDAGGIGEDWRRTDGGKAPADRPVRLLEQALTYLLDTHTFVWALADTTKLSQEALAIISDVDVEILVSPATAYEIVFKHALGRWPEISAIASDVDGWVDRSGFRELDITFKHMMLAGSLATVHRDPFDRILAAQALTEAIPLITRDPEMAAFGLAVVSA